MERRTREEFEKLHSFLDAEEEARMEALRGEEEQKRRALMEKIEEINRNITSVSESIRGLEEEIALEGISVLHVSLKYIKGYLHKNTFLFLKQKMPLFFSRNARGHWKGD